MATARVSELKALTVTDVAAGNKKWTIPVSNMDVDVIQVDMLNNQMMVGEYDTLAGRGGSRKIAGSFDTHLYGGQGVTKSTVISTAAAIGKVFPLLCLFQTAGFALSVNTAAGTDFGLTLSDNPNTDVTPTLLEYWQGDLFISPANVVSNVDIAIKGGEYINLNWNFMGQYSADPTQSATYPTYSFGATDMAGLNGKFSLAFYQPANGSIALVSFAAHVTSDILEMNIKPNNNITMNKDITEKWGYSEAVIVAPRQSEVMFKARAPYSIGESGTDFWKMLQCDFTAGSVAVSPQAESAIGKITYAVTGTGFFNTYQITAYFKMKDAPKITTEDGVMYYNVVGQIYPYTVGGKTKRPLTIKVSR